MASTFTWIACNEQGHEDIKSLRQIISLQIGGKPDRESYMLLKNFLEPTKKEEASWVP